MNTPANPTKHLFSRGAKLCIAVLILAAVSTQILNVNSVFADDSTNYTWYQAPPINTSPDTDSDYGWVPPCPPIASNCTSFEYVKNGVTYGEGDTWGYGFRNCTSYIAWKMNQLFGVNISGWGHAKNWSNETAYPKYSPSSYTPVIGDIAQWNAHPGDSDGHVAYVWNVEHNGVADLWEYNQAYTGKFDNTRSTAQGSDGTPSWYIHVGNITPPPPPLTLRIGMVDNSNTFWVKENTVGALWDNENTGVSQGLVSGSLIADLVGGTFQVKQGTIGALWDNEDTGITQGSISDATATAPLRIGVLTNTGSFLVKDGGLGAPWVDEYEGVSQGVLSGSLVGAVTTGGLFPSGTYIVKQGDLGQPWVNEYPNVSSGTLSDATSSTPLRIGALTTSGAYWVKEGGLGATFTNEYNSVSQGMLSGNLIGVLSGGTYLVKQATLGATWTNEQTAVVTSGTLWSLN